MKITSSLLNQHFSSTSLVTELTNLIKDKVLDDCDKNPELLQKHIDEIEFSMKKGKETIVLVSSDDETFCLKKSEIENILQNYINQAIKLLNAVLIEQNICRKNEVKRIDVFSSVFPAAFGSILKTKCLKIVDQKNIHIDQKDTNSIASIAKLVCTNHVQTLLYFSLKFL